MRAAPTLAARLLGLGIAAAALGVAVPPAARLAWRTVAWRSVAWRSVARRWLAWRGSRLARWQLGVARGPLELLLAWRCVHRGATRLRTASGVLSAVLLSAGLLSAGALSVRLLALQS